MLFTTCLVREFTNTASEEGAVITNKGGDMLILNFRAKEEKMEVCPKCGSMFIEWDSLHDCFRCLERKCQYKWTEWPKGPKKYDGIKNECLKLSIPWQSPIPYANTKK